MGGISDLCNTAGEDRIDESFNEVYRETSRSLRIPLVSTNSPSVTRKTLAYGRACDYTAS